MLLSLDIQIGGAALDLKTCPTKPFNWILDMVWLNLVELSKLLLFNNIINQVSVCSTVCILYSSYYISASKHIFVGGPKWEKLESMAQS